MVDLGSHLLFAPKHLSSTHLTILVFYSVLKVDAGFLWGLKLIFCLCSTAYMAHLFDVHGCEHRI